MIVAEEGWIRLGSFVAVLLMMNLWEWLAPRRQWKAQKSPRLCGNYLLAVLNTLVLRIATPLSAMAVALVCEQREFGLFYFFELGDTANLVATILLLDFAIYSQHVLFHIMPVFWRIHQIHHADLDLDVSSGLRFHTLEILLSMLIKMGAVAVLGASARGVILFEVILNATAMFNHSNVKLPLKLDAVLRMLIVTPDMHRVHHSIYRQETNSNFGFSLSCWDRLFRTYIEQPRDGHEEMQIGLSECRDEKTADRLWGMLKMPFGKNRDAGE
ncbi:MAG: sterol desaturase family protein [Planctomycetaceae bacterium]|jgi:sterol desaturase/sphingolipid hydroxylase (fatty acid hydroxylase superfamily)|nr:sterol desaturase family protein [Planctomycetaceae bacterium]MDG2388744.1 sterol desaturase family protein [Planctomycetaceae bacterium]